MKKKILSGLLIGAFVFGVGAMNVKPVNASSLDKVAETKDKFDQNKQKFDKTKDKFGQARDSDKSNRPTPPTDENGNPMPPPDRNGNNFSDRITKA